MDEYDEVLAEDMRMLEMTFQAKVQSLLKKMQKCASDAGYEPIGQLCDEIVHNKKEDRVVTFDEETEYGFLFELAEPLENAIDLDMNHVDITARAALEIDHLSTLLLELEPRETPWSRIASHIWELHRIVRAWDCYYVNAHIKTILILLNDVDQLSPKKWKHITGGRTTGANAEKKRCAFIKIYLDEKKQTPPNLTKEAVVQNSISRFKDNNGIISMRTAWSYLKGID